MRGEGEQEGEVTAGAWEGALRQHHVHLHWELPASCERGWGSAQWMRDVSFSTVGEGRVLHPGGVQIFKK